MSRTNRHLKLIAAVLLVFFVVSGFSPARSGGGGGRGGSGGGKSHGGGGFGCSSNKSSSHNSSSTGGGYYGSDDADDDYDSDYDSEEYDDHLDDAYGSDEVTASPTPGPEPVGTIVTCAGPTREEASVEIEPMSGSEEEYFVKVDFYGERDRKVDTATATFTLAAGGTHTVDVPMSDPSLADEVERCELVYVTTA